MKLLLGLLHSKFAVERHQPFEKLYASLLEQCQRLDVELYTHIDTEGRGSTPPWLHMLARVEQHPTASHFSFLPDDAIVVPHFVEVLKAAIASHPEDVLCFQSNHHGSVAASQAGARWYTTSDGFTCFAGTMPIRLWREHCHFRRTELRSNIGTAGDHAVNLWCMATNRLIYKSLPSLVDHDTSLPSCDGNDGHVLKSPRRPLVWDQFADLRKVDWSGPVVHLGRTYDKNHWGLLTKLREPLPRRAYALERDHTILKVEHAC